jgi:hypothetical protein
MSVASNFCRFVEALRNPTPISTQPIIIFYLIHVPKFKISLDSWVFFTPSHILDKHLRYHLFYLFHCKKNIIAAAVTITNLRGDADETDSIQKCLLGGLVW